MKTFSKIKTSSPAGYVGMGGLKGFLCQKSKSYLLAKIFVECIVSVLQKCCMREQISHVLKYCRLVP